MRILFSTLAFSAAFLLFAQSGVVAQSMKLTKVWESDTTLTTPESVLYDAKANVLYVSCINGGPAPENAKSFIAKVAPDGKIIKRNFTENLTSTKGMAIFGNKLYVTEILKLVETDLKTGKVLKKYDVPEAKFLNDIAIDPKGVVYFTDMRGNRIWMLNNGKMEKVAEEGELKNPNGLLYENGKLLVGNGDGKLLVYDLKAKQFGTFAEGMGGIDGIAADGKKGYFVSEWKGKIWHISADGKPESLLDSEAQKINTADLDYNPAKKMLYVPTFFVNKVMAYSVE
jgi:sugar lactone lactonase YvrE